MNLRHGKESSLSVFPMIITLRRPKNIWIYPFPLVVRTSGGAHLSPLFNSTEYLSINPSIQKQALDLEISRAT